MSNRFANDKSDRHHRKLWSFIYISICIVIACGFIAGLDTLGKDTVTNQQESLQRALHRDIIQCYSIEGIYPPSLDYIKEHYGLTYDESLFFVDYQPIGANIYPDVTIVCLEEKGDDRLITNIRKNN
ncbi:MAG: hypothetical protein K6A23_06440 [Butyrivibrio sp.]|nr:hypothetical protein [Butyrivibrio sp.]